MVSLVDRADGDADAQALGQDVSLTFINHNAVDIYTLCLQVSCTCKNTCQRSGKCPCKTAKKLCTGRCKCGTKKQPCKNRVLPQLPQQPSLGEQLSPVKSLLTEIECNTSEIPSIFLSNTIFCTALKSFPLLSK